MEKAEKGWWSKLLRGDTKTPHYVKIDWDKWVDEDDDNNNANDGLYSILLIYSIFVNLMILKT